jgi:hypothetical protein
LPGRGAGESLAALSTFAPSKRARCSGLHRLPPREFILGVLDRRQGHRIVQVQRLQKGEIMPPALRRIERGGSSIKPSINFIRPSFPGDPAQAPLRTVVALVGCRLCTIRRDRGTSARDARSGRWPPLGAEELALSPRTCRAPRIAAISVRSRSIARPARSRSTPTTFVDDIGTVINPLSAN